MEDEQIAKAALDAADESAAPTPMPSLAANVMLDSKSAAVARVAAKAEAADGPTVSLDASSAQQQAEALARLARWSVDTNYFPSSWK